MKYLTNKVLDLINKINKFSNYKHNNILTNNINKIAIINHRYKINLKTLNQFSSLMKIYKSNNNYSKNNL
jgi:hypothetical protein